MGPTRRKATDLWLWLRPRQPYIRGLDVGRTMARVPGHRFVVLADRCFGCAACVALCPPQALHLDAMLAWVHEDTCTHCRLCLPACPVHALDIVTDDVFAATVQPDIVSLVGAGDAP